MLTFSAQQKIISEILKRPSNNQCADCNTISPTWASLDFGIFICSNCSGAHRALGPTITRVKSTKLDSWHQQWLSNMQIGNKEINQFWQAKLTAMNKQQLIQIRKPKMGSSLQQINRYVTDKYIKRKYVAQGTDPLTNLKKEKEQQNNKPMKKQEPHHTHQPKQIIPPTKNIKQQQNLIDFDFLPATKSDGHHHSEDQFGNFSGVTEPKELTYADLLKQGNHKHNNLSHPSHYNVHHTLHHPLHQNTHPTNQTNQIHQQTHNRAIYHSLSHQNHPYVGSNITQVQGGQYGWQNHNHHYHTQNLIGINSELPINAKYPQFSPITLVTHNHNHKHNHNPTKKQQQSWVNSWK